MIMTNVDKIKYLDHKLSVTVQKLHKNSHNAYLEGIIDNFRVLVYIFMESYNNGNTASAIGFKYNWRKGISFISAPDL